MPLIEIASIIDTQTKDCSIINELICVRIMCLHDLLQFPCSIFLFSPPLATRPRTRKKMANFVPPLPNGVLPTEYARKFGVPKNYCWRGSISLVRLRLSELLGGSLMDEEYADLCTYTFIQGQSQSATSKSSNVSTSGTPCAPRAGVTSAFRISSVVESKATQRRRSGCGNTV